MRKALKNKVKEYKIYWYRLIPFVIAEIINPEWEKLQPLIKEGKVSTLLKIYNTNGNWYVLEGLDLFLFERLIFSSKGFLFSDSLCYQYINLKDEAKYKRLLNEAHEDIDNFWKNFTINNLTNKINKIYGKANSFITGSKKKD
jgi:hypothetical protein